MKLYTTQTIAKFISNSLIINFLAKNILFFWIGIFMPLSVIYAQNNESFIPDSSFQVTHTDGEFTPSDIRENQILRESAVREHNALIFSVIICFLLLISLMFVGRLYYRQKSDNQKLREEMDEYRRTIGQKAHELGRAHDELIISNAVLEERAVSQRETLHHAQHEAEIAHIEFERFLSSSSYYFSRPLSSLKGLIQVARLVNETPNVAQMSDLFNKMETTLGLIDSMIDKLLMLERIKSRKLPSEKVDFELIIKKTKEKYADKINENSLDYQYKINAVKNIIYPTEIIEIILDNFIENSVIYTAYQRHPYIFIDIEITQTDIMIKVADNGVGIPEVFINRIYNMFYRASELAKGCGLGLYVVKMAVEKYTGSIKVESKQGKFTEFTVTLPIYHGNR